MTGSDRLKPGPRPKPDDEKVIKKTVSLQPATFAYLSEVGKGVLSRGIEAVVAQLRKR